MAFELLTQRPENPVPFLNGFLCWLPTTIRSLWLATEPTIDGSLLTTVIRSVHVSHTEAGGREVYVS